MFHNVFDEDDELSLLEDVVGSQTSMNDEQPGKLCVKNLTSFLFFTPPLRFFCQNLHNFQIF